MPAEAAAETVTFTQTEDAEYQLGDAYCATCYLVDAQRGAMHLTVWQVLWIAPDKQVRGL